MKQIWKFIRYWLIKPVIKSRIKREKFESYAFRDGMLAAISDTNITDSGTELALNLAADRIYEYSIKESEQYWNDVLIGNK